MTVTSETGNAAHPGTSTALREFRDVNGYFTMVAIDQRSSLREMLTAANGGTAISDTALEEFKADVADSITPLASGILLDRQFGLPAAKAAKCPVILAADILSASVRGGPVDTSRIDLDITSGVVEEFGASALKLLVPWRKEGRAEAIDLAAEFMSICRDFGLPGVVEGVVRPPGVASWSIERRHEALIAAAADLSSTQPDLYKTEVVFREKSHALPATEAAHAITEIMNCPWVLLSSGIPYELFPRAVAAACIGGASGFLAGRAVWGTAVSARDPRSHIRESSVRAFQSLCDSVRGTRS